MKFLGLIVQTPTIIHCDNVGAIFMRNGVKESLRTKYIVSIREHIVDWSVEIVFVPSEKNDAAFLPRIFEERYT